MKIIICYGWNWRFKHNKFDAKFLDGKKVVAQAEGPTRADAIVNLFRVHPEITLERDEHNNYVEDQTGVPQHIE